MAYLANDLILAVMAVLLIFFLAKKDWMKAISISAFAYCCAPVLKLQNGGINSAYLFTFILGIWIIILFVKKSIIWSRKLTLFFIGNIISIAVVGVSWLLNGQCELAHLIHFAGMGQWMLGVIALYVICPDLGKFSKAFYTGIKISIVWNFFVTIVQMFVPQIGLSMTRLLYTYQGKDASIIFMEKEGRFLRAFGTFYSSTETGGFALLAIVLMLVAVYERKKWKQELPFLFMILFVGLFAFSKAVILGVFIVFVLLNIFFYLMKLRLELKKIIVCFSLIIFSFFSVAIIGKSNGLSGQVDYYFGKILLGAGGLVRAYSTSAIKALEKVKLVEEIKGIRLKIEIEYRSLEKLQYYCKKSEIEIENVEYRENVFCIVAVKDKDEISIFTNLEKNPLGILNCEILGEKTLRKSKK